MCPQWRSTAQGSMRGRLCSKPFRRPGRQRPPAPGRLPRLPCPVGCPARSQSDAQTFAVHGSQSATSCGEMVAMIPVLCDELLQPNALGAGAGERQVTHRPQARHRWKTEGRTERRNDGILRGVFALALMLVASEGQAIGICAGANRAAREVTCLVDGDTGWEQGVKWRMLDIDAPETSGAECSAEKSTGDRATARLRELMASGYRLQRPGRKDRTSDRRDLVHVVLADGRDAGQVLMAEGLAQPWLNRGNRWCGR